MKPQVLCILQLLNEGKSYNDIVSATGASKSTIAKLAKAIKAGVLEDVPGVPPPDKELKYKALAVECKAELDSANEHIAKLERLLDALSTD